MKNLNVITKRKFKKVCFQILLKKFDEAFMSQMNRQRVPKEWLCRNVAVYIVCGTVLGSSAVTQELV